MAIARVGGTPYYNVQDSATALVLTNPNPHSAGHEFLMAVVKYSPTADAPVLGDISQTSGDGVVGTWRLDHVQSYNTTGSQYLHAALYAAPVTSTGQINVTVGGGVSGCYWWGCSWSISGTAINVEDTDQGTGAADSGAPTTGNATSAGAGYFVGVMADSTGVDEAITEDAAWALLGEETNGASHVTGAAIDRAVGTGTTDAASWTAPTNRAYTAIVVVYREGAGAVNVSVTDGVLQTTPF